MVMMMIMLPMISATDGSFLMTSRDGDNDDDDYAHGDRENASGDDDAHEDVALCRQKAQKVPTQHRHVTAIRIAHVQGQ